MLWVLCKVIYDTLSLALITEGQRIEVVIEAELLVGIRLVLLELADEPHVAISGKEHLAWHLVHVVSADDATTLALINHLLNLLYFVSRGQVHRKTCLRQTLVRQSVNIVELELGHVCFHPSRVAGCELKVKH